MKGSCVLCQCLSTLSCGLVVGSEQLRARLCARRDHPAPFQLPFGNNYSRPWACCFSAHNTPRKWVKMGVPSKSVSPQGQMSLSLRCQCEMEGLREFGPCCKSSFQRAFWHSSTIRLREVASWAVLRVRMCLEMMISRVEPAH